MFNCDFLHPECGPLQLHLTAEMILRQPWIKSDILPVNLLLAGIFPC